MKQTIPTIVVNKNTPRVVETFSTIGNVRPLATSEVTPRAVRDADILIVRSETRVDARLLEGSTVKFVGTVTIGTDHVDTGYLSSKNIRFVSAPGSNANSVAEYCAAAFLVLAHRTRETLAGKQLGIVGVGHVGSKVAAVGSALGMEVLLNDPPRARQTGDTVFRPMDELMDADIISLHVPLTTSGPDATFHLFDETRLMKMKKGSVLMNTSRGPVVDSACLLASLRSKQLSTAILDVWETEPLVESALLEHVMIGTPHIAGYSLEGKLNALRMVYEEACRFLGMSPAPEEKIPVNDPVIQVPEQSGNAESIAYEVVRQAYDIELDDQKLRGIAFLPPEERKEAFMKLRADYPVRREFSQRIVAFSSGQNDIRNLFERLGLNVRTRLSVKK